MCSGTDGVESVTKLLKMLKPLESGGSSKTLAAIEQLKVNTMAQIYEMCFDATTLPEATRDVIREVVSQENAYWRAKWCVKVRSSVLSRGRWGD